MADTTIPPPLDIREKLAALLTACNEVSHILAQHGCTPALSGASPFSYRAATMLRDAIAEAKKP